MWTCWHGLGGELGREAMTPSSSPGEPLIFREEFTIIYTTLHQNQQVLTWGHSLLERSGPISQTLGADSLGARVLSPVVLALQGTPVWQMNYDAAHRVLYQCNCVDSDCGSYNREDPQ